MVKLVEARAVRKSYDLDGSRVEVLRDVSLSVEEGEFVCVMGPSGSGKTTLLLCLSGMDRPSLGQVLLGGADLFSESERKRTLRRRRTLGFVFQFFNLLPDLSVEENLELPILISGEDPSAYRERTEELLDSLDLGELRQRLPHRLSGGEMQRVSIGRALATRPPLILADEPTGNLSSRAGEETMQLFRSVSDRLGTAILLVTHNPRDAAFGDRVLFLRDGVLDPSNALEGPDLNAALVFSRLEELGI
ncbi:MAG: ABC transporter ATP-binding protein [Planctomycetota bacterium]